MFFIFVSQFVAKYGTKYDYLKNVHARMANYNGINNISKVSVRKETREGHEILNKITPHFCLISCDKL